MTDLLSPAAPVTPLHHFHGPFDDPAYASLFGAHHAVRVAGGRLLYTLRDDEAISGPSASFGGLALEPRLVERLRLSELVGLLEQLAEAVAAQTPSARRLVLRLAPSSYYPAQVNAALASAFAISGWQPTGEVSQVVYRDGWQPRDTVACNTRKLEREGASLKALSAAECFDFLAPIKRQKEYAFHYTREGLSRQAQAFPGHFHFHGVHHPAAGLVACVMEFRLPEAAMLIAWDQSEAGKRLGALDLLLLRRLEGLFDDGCRFVDLGTVTTRREPSWGLVSHKEKFRAIADLRQTYQRVLAPPSPSLVQ